MLYRAGAGARAGAGGGLGRILALCGMLALFLGPVRLVGQTPRLVVEGKGEPALDARLEAVLAADHILITRDTVLMRNETITRPLLIVDAVVALEATVRADVVVVDGHLFLRPNARIEGGVVNLGGGFYRSDLAVVTGDIVNEPLAPYVATRQDDGSVHVRAGSRLGPIVLEGPFGLSLPTYDRVNGLTAGWGAGVRLPVAAALRPELHGRAFYFSERGDFGWRGELRLRADTTRISVGGERHWATNERWIKGDVINSLVYLVRGRDRRDYYDATRFWAEVAHPWRTGGVDLVTRVRAQREEADPLRADDPWSITSPDSVRPNLAARGTVTSAVLESEAHWLGATSLLDLSAALELASEVWGGDDAFGAFVADLDFAMRAIADHTLAIEAHASGPLPGTSSLPTQRWSFVGGSGTINVLEEAEMRGDRVAFVETTYRIPLPERFTVRVLGRPSFELLHAAGAAWTDTVERDLAQEIGAQIRLGFLYLRVLTDPADTENTEFAVGLKNPIGAGFPWEARGR